MIGSRGVPATHGGVEHHVEQLGARLVERGHDVTVYCRTNYLPEPRSEYRGMRLVSLPSVSSKNLDAIVHSGLSAAHSLFEPYDVVHYHNAGPGLAAPISRLRRHRRIVLTVHSFNSEHEKWGVAARTLLRTADRLSVTVPNATVVVSRAWQQAIRDRYQRETTVIANGVIPPVPATAGPFLQKLGLTKGRYALFVGRLVPEKGIDLLVEGFRASNLEDPLVIVGGSSFSDEYVQQLHVAAASDPRIRFVGFRFRDELRELLTNAGCLVQPSRSEGMPLALLEAASYDLPIVATAIPAHVELLHTSRPGLRLCTPLSATALAAAISQVRNDGQPGATNAREFGAFVRNSYSWETAADEHEHLYRGLIDRTRP